MAAAKAGSEEEEEPKMTVVEAFRFLIASKQVRCLALMAMSQGIATNLLEVRLCILPPPHPLPHLPPLPQHTQGIVYCPGWVVCTS